MSLHKRHTRRKAISSNLIAEPIHNHEAISQEEEKHKKWTYNIMKQKQTREK